MVNENGETLANYRKQHLDYADKGWAFEGAGGFFHDVIDGLGRVTMGVCTDIDPSETPWHQFEFAFDVLDSEANVVIVSMAWSASALDNPASFHSKPDEPHMATLEHWVKRMEPLIRADRDDEIIFVFANRCGSEGDVLYTGSSAVIGICNGEVRVYGVLGRGTKQLLVVDTDEEPSARLVRRSGKRAADDSCNVVGDDLLGPARTVEGLAVPHSSQNICPRSEIDTRELASIHMPESTAEISTNAATNIRPKSPKKTRHLACAQTQMPIPNRPYRFDFAMRKPATVCFYVLPNDATELLLDILQRVDQPIPVRLIDHLPDEDLFLGGLSSKAGEWCFGSSFWEKIQISRMQSETEITIKLVAMSKSTSDVKYQ